MNNKKLFFISICILFCTFLVPTVSHAQDASLSISPATGVYPIGEPFTIEVRIDTGGTNIGTVRAVIAYDPQDVSFESSSNTGSILNTVIVDSKNKGEVVVDGMITYGQSGFNGDNGLVVKLTFLPIRNVATQFHFASGSANPPIQLGASVVSLSNIISTLQVATYTFIPKETAVAGTPFAFAQSEFEITPLPVPAGEWFGTSSITLSWTVPNGATAMRTLVSSNKDDTPSKEYATPQTSVTLKGVSEGLNYFLLQFMFNGEWGSVIKYPLNVDVSSPSYVLIKEADRVDESDPRVGFIIESTDTFSGVERYEVSIDDDPATPWERPENGIYRPEGLTPGEHILSAYAYDRVGNSTSTDMLFLVKSLDAPILKNESVPTRVLTGDTITIQGSSYPDAEVTVYISQNEGEAMQKVVTTDANGDFVATITEAAKSGKYTLWFSVKDKRGGLSPNSVKRSIEVTQPSIILFGTTAVTYLSIIVPLIGLISLLVLILWLGYTWMRSYRTRIQHETGEAYTVARNEFKNLRKELITQIGMLEKANQSRELTREEMRIFNDLSKRLDKIERHITEEIEDIEAVQYEEEDSVDEHRVEGSFEKYKNKVKLADQAPMHEGIHTLRL